MIQKDKKGRDLFFKVRVRSFFDYELYEIIDNLLIVEFQIHIGYNLFYKLLFLIIGVMGFVLMFILG